MDAAGWDTRYASEEFVWSIDANRWVVAELAELPPGRALDIAAGEGRNAIWLAEHGWDVTAVDFSGEALAKGRRRAAEHPGSAALRVAWVQADVLRYEPAVAAYDLVLICFLHVPTAERRTVHRRAMAAVAPGGLLLVIGHDSSNLTEGWGGPQHPEVLFGPELVLADLGVAERPELVVERAERVRRPVDTPEGPRTAIDALVRIRAAATG
ncbi:MAG: class I SAM-dependent methyltransferase [Actinobacteria bacterium]|nr:class I SAM-dependent methyltransferase [Actinomycetota bacterium]MBI3685861.1 class I SAM-dependent methyltransferase [Actinomycetota bacterium]